MRFNHSSPASVPPRSAPPKPPSRHTPSNKSYLSCLCSFFSSLPFPHNSSAKSNIGGPSLIHRHPSLLFPHPVRDSVWNNSNPRTNPRTNGRLSPSTEFLQTLLFSRSHRRWMPFSLKSLSLVCKEPGTLLILAWTARYITGKIPTPINSDGDPGETELLLMGPCSPGRGKVTIHTAAPVPRTPYPRTNTPLQLYIPTASGIMSRELVIAVVRPLVEMGFSCPDLLFVFFDAFLSLLGRRLASGFARTGDCRRLASMIPKAKGQA